ncbi:unnamed protein product [Aureobasidium mustum]|uniref:F-box domain-containing protein n=1 Tax=Aureobasidium mustum TaxID=2773714 RepID=A0A9N8K0C4_9PEZI|nr:unnamed protein product [Aureobasidium mustum]
MRETRLQTKKRAEVRKQVILNIKSKNKKPEDEDKKSKDPVDSTTAMANKSSQDSSVEHVPTGVFPLLRLPTEVQIMVYEYVVEDSEEIIMLENAQTPALARVNRYLRSAVLPIFLGTNTFRVFTEEAPIAKDSQAKEAKFKIQNSVMEWLTPLGYNTPLFKSLVVHFGVENQTELVLKYSRKAGCKIGSLTVGHEGSCRFCYKLEERYPVFPRAILSSLACKLELGSIIDKNEERHIAMEKEHQRASADLEANVFGKTTGIKRDALAISMANIMGLERVINEGQMTFAMAVHTINMKRLADTPCVIKYKDKMYVLRKDTSV